MVVQPRYFFSLNHHPGAPRHPSYPGGVIRTCPRPLIDRDLHPQQIGKFFHCRRRLMESRALFIGQ